MKELEDIIKKHFGETRWMLTGEIQKTDMLLFAKEIYNKGVTDSAESAEAYTFRERDSIEISAYVSEQSILKLLIP